MSLWPCQSSLGKCYLEFDTCFELGFSHVLSISKYITNNHIQLPISFMDKIWLKEQVKLRLTFNDQSRYEEGEWSATTFCRPKWPRWLFAVFFWLLTKLEDKKGCATFCRPFGDFLPSKTQKRTAKAHAAFLSSKRMPRTHQKVAWLILSSDWSATFFGRQKVA